ncbi:MAG: hypothetical protein AB7S77_24440 [Desulfatirhabdiaceae bacterium]
MNLTTFKIRAFCDHHSRFLQIMAAGLLLRLLVMPFFAHVDFLSEYARVFKSISSGNVFAYSSRMVLSLIEISWMTLCLPLISDGGTTFLLGNSSQATAGLSEYFLFVSDPGIYRTLFLLKIPYLAFDLGTAAVLFQIFSGNDRKWTALKLWLFNPVTLYAFYFFGRYESVPLFFIALTLLMLVRQKHLLAALVFGIALNCREINIIYVPLLLLSLAAWPLSFRQLAKTVFPATLIILGCYLLPLEIKHLAHVQPQVMTQLKTESDFGHALFGMRYGWLIPFIFSYCGICLWLIESRRDLFYKFTLSACLVMISFLLFVAHSAHYVSWMMVFPIVLLGLDRNTLRPLVLFCCAWILFWAFRTDAGVFTLFLASPLSMNFFGWRTLPQVYSDHVGHQSLINLDMLILIARNIYGACLAYLGYQAVRVEVISRG